MVGDGGEECDEYALTAFAAVNECATALQQVGP